jgi:TPP-dependent pyruvate/acetoin dehydrogenase alpha subunit
MVSMLPDMMAVAVGMAWAFKLRGEQRCALSFFGDGATSVGDWHEAMNLAGLWRVPAIFVLEHNGYAYSTPSARQFVVDPLERAAVYGSRACRSTATTSRRCSRRPGRRASARWPAAARR